MKRITSLVKEDFYIYYTLDTRQNVVNVMRFVITCNGAPSFPSGPKHLAKTRMRKRFVRPNHNKYGYWCHTDESAGVRHHLSIGGTVQRKGIRNKHFPT